MHAIPADLALIIIAGLATGELYAAALRPREHIYNPHYTWVTVVIGVILTWLLFVALAVSGYVAWPAVGWFVVVFCLTGFGILRWQWTRLLNHWRRQREKRDGAKDEGWR